MMWAFDTTADSPHWLHASAPSRDAHKHTVNKAETVIQAVTQQVATLCSRGWAGEPAMTPHPCISATASLATVSCVLQMGCPPV